MGELKCVTSRLGIPTNGEFEDYYEEVQAKHKKEQDCKEIPLEECKEKFMCKDGKVLTTKKLREMLNAHVDAKLYKIFSPNFTCEHILSLAFFAYHGNRPQDWCVGYGQVNKNNTGYYDPHTNMIHLFEGKTQQEGTERIFKVHPYIQECIESLNHDAWLRGDGNLFYLVQNSKGECGNTKTIRDRIKTICKNSILPTITPNDLRHLYETHIRYVEKLPRNERLELMGGIAHSDSTSMKRYAQTYRAMVEWAEANEQ
jgi:integrase